MKYAAALGAALAFVAAAAFAASVIRTEANNGNLVMEDVPPIPADIVDALNRYQNVRSANFEGWQDDGAGICISTRFAGVDQLHRAQRRVEYGDERDPALRAYLEKISPLNNVEKISVPMFAVQGENDPRVPVTEATQMVAALREQGNTVWYMNALNEGHGYRKRENRDIYQQATVLFLQQYLVGGE